MSASGSCSCEPGCTCGACRGIRDATPLEVGNRPGLSAIRYRVGDHARFKESLLAGISRGRMPALRGLTTRRDDDLSIALLDAVAVMADILTFYQERIANESYLQTAVERLSVGYLAKLIGYELRPGSAARVSLAFQMTEGPGAVETLRLAVGTRVQSTPGPDEKPQTFETVEEIEVRPEWNAIPVRTVRTQELSAVMPEILLKGAALNLRAGDALLLVFQTPGGSDFTAVFRRIQSLEVDARGEWTRARLQPGGSVQAKFDGLTTTQTGVFVFRKQAALFGHNAPDFVLLNTGMDNALPGSDWDPAAAGNSATELVLDAAYREVVPGGFGLWESPGVPGSPMIVKVASVAEQGRAAFGLSAKVTRIQLTRGKGVTTSAQPGTFPELRSVSVLLQSEKLPLHEIPVRWPVPVEWPPATPWPAVRKTLFLAREVHGLPAGRRVAVSGKRLRVEALEPVDVFLLTQTGIVVKSLALGDIRDLWHFPLPLDGGGTFFGVRVEGELGLAWTTPGQARVRLDEGAELATVAVLEGTTLTLKEPLLGIYDPPTVRVNANVVEATHGETVAEVFEGGDATQVFQRFALKQTPVTHVPATTATGTVSTLRVWVEDVEWHEVPYFHGHGPKERVFISRMDGEGKTWIQFGDGVTGARLPTGPLNVRAEYRRGIGAAANLKAGQLNLLVSRPLGLKDAVNPLPSSDGKDPEALEDARRNAPLTVLTLDRVVSLQDYEDFARAFAGVAKAAATWAWFGQSRGVFITVSGEAGSPLSPEGRKTLRDAIAAWGDPYVSVRVENHAAATFRTGVRLAIDPDRQADQVLDAVERVLRDTFSFERRAFGQDVSAAVVAAAAQAVPGVIAVQVTRLYLSGGLDPAAGLTVPLPARIPLPGERDAILPGELLTLDPAPLDLLEAMA